MITLGSLFRAGLSALTAEDPGAAAMTELSAVRREVHSATVAERVQRGELAAAAPVADLPPATDRSPHHED